MFSKSEALATCSDNSWKTDQLIISRAGNISLKQLKDGAIDVAFPTGHQKYTYLANFLLSKFMGSLPDTNLSHRDRSIERGRVERAEAMTGSGKPGIRTGFNVMGRLLCLSVAAYKVHCTDRGEEPRIEEARSILKHAETVRGTLRWFSDVPNNINRIREEVFCIRSSTFTTLIEENPFRVSIDSNGLSYISKRGEFTMQASVEARNYSQRPAKETEKCPAGIWLPRLWGEMVDIACDTPELIPTDLRLLEVE